MARIRRHRRDTVQSPLETYLREINEMALLTADEEKKLAHRIADGDDQARDRMVRANLRLVVNIARGYVGKGLALQDLIEEGNLGLLRAVEGFDPDGRHPVQHLCQLLDQAVDQAGAGQHGQADPDSRLHGGAALQVAADGGRPAGIAGPARRRSRRSPRRSKLPKKKLAIVKKAIKVYNLVPQTDQPENGWSLGEMLMDERTRRPDVEMVEADNLRLVHEPARRDGQARGHRPADAVRPQRRAAEDAQGDRRVARPDPRARPADRERSARQALGVAPGRLSPRRTELEPVPAGPADRRPRSVPTARDAVACQASMAAPKSRAAIAAPSARGPGAGSARGSAGAGCLARPAGWSAACRPRSSDAKLP